MNLTERPPEFVHAFNPVKFVFEVQRTFISCEFRLYIADQTYVFNGLPNGNRTIAFDICDVLQAYVFPAYVPESGAISFPVSGVLCPFSIEYWDYDEIEGHGDSNKYYFSALYGGVSNQMLRYLNAVGLNLFEYRLKNYTRQFLFTTRTNSRVIKIRETELSPLLYLVPEQTISVVDEYGHVLLIVPDPGTIGQVYALSLVSIRQYFFDTCQVVSCYFSFLIEGNSVFSVAILPGSNSVHRRILSFRNSLGCYECIEVTGQPETKVSFDEDSIFNVYDDDTSSFTENRFRRVFQDEITVSAGYKTVEELNFIRDLLSSDDVFLLDGKERTKVIVSAEEFSIKPYTREPQSIELTVKIAEKDSIYTPSINEQIATSNSGEAFFLRGYLNAWGYIFSDAKINTV